MNQFKRVQVVMLPTNILSNISLSNRTNNLIYNKDKHDTLSMFTNQHLYIISNDEIKEGDWVCDGITIMKASSKLVDAQGLIGRRDWKKIIATTDTNISSKEITSFGRQFTKPSQQFIEKFIESYNKGEVITDVLVEYEIDTKTVNYALQQLKIKVNPKDNTITIKKLKENWNREEVIKLLKLLKKDTINSIDLDINTDNLICDLEINKWIEKNL